MWNKYWCAIFILGVGIIVSISGELYAQVGGKSISRVQRRAALIQVDSARVFVGTNPQKAFDHIEKALKLSGETGDKLSEGLTYQVLGILNMNLSQNDLAKGYLEKSLAVLESTKNDSAIMSTNLLLGEVSAREKDYINADRYYNRVLAWAKKTGDRNLELTVRNRLGEVYSKKGDTPQALEMYQKILKDEKDRENVDGMIVAQNKMGAVYEQSNRPAEAISAYQNSEDLSRKTKNASALKNTLTSKSNALRSSKKYSEEMKVREELLDMSKEKMDIPGQAEQNLEIGNILMEQNKNENAIPYIKKSVELSGEGGNLEGKGAALRALSTAYDKSRQYDKALSVYKEYVATIDIIHQKKEQEIRNNISMLTELNRKLERLSLIERDLELSEQRIKLMEQEQVVDREALRAQQIFTWSLLAALVGLSVASFFIYRGTIEKRKANQSLALQSLRGQMNPHFIFNSLNSVNSYISRNDERTANKYLSEFARLMRAVMEQSRFDFISVAAELEILKLYLSLEHSRFADKFDYSLEIEDEAAISELEIPPMLIQPYIENAIWHGLRYLDNKGKLMVRLGRAGETFLAAVEDNGIGRKKSLEIKTSHQQAHVSTGMKNIEHRLVLIHELFGLKIDVTVEDLDPVAESGTRVNLVIPVRNNKN